MNNPAKRRSFLWVGFIIAIAILLLPAAACGKKAGGLGVEITDPKDGATVSAGNVKVSAKVTGDANRFKIVNKLSQPKVAGEGHIHYYLDAGTIPTAAGKPAVTAEGTFHAVPDVADTWVNVTPGKHTLVAQLANNDHTPLEPPVVSKAVIITVK